MTVTDLLVMFIIYKRNLNLVYCLTGYVLLQENIYFVIYVLMSTLYFYLTLLLVPIVALLGDFTYKG